MTPIDPKHGIGTLVNHVAEGGDPLCAHIAPIYQTSTFRFPDVDTGAARFRGEEEGYIYSRYDNPNLRQAAAKIAALEGWICCAPSPAEIWMKSSVRACLPRGWQRSPRRSSRGSKAAARSLPRSRCMVRPTISCVMLSRSTLSASSGSRSRRRRPGKPRCAPTLERPWSTPRRRSTRRSR